MATERQIEANRQNALLSTGPKTDDGKARSSVNAITHGLTSARIELSPLAIDRKRLWEKEIKPATEEARFALDVAVAASMRIDDCDQAYQAMKSEAVQRAQLDWDGDRKLDAARLVDRLPKKPVLIAVELEATPQGCEHKINLWNSLGETIETVGTWTDAQSSLALDLLGVSLALRNGPTPIEQRSGLDVVGHRVDLAMREIKRLRARIEELRVLDSHRRNQALRGVSAILTAPAALIQRYERDATRRFNAAMKIAKAKTQVESSVVVKEILEEEEAEVEEDALSEFEAPESTVLMPAASLSHLNRRQRMALKAQKRRA